MPSAERGDRGAVAAVDDMTAVALADGTVEGVSPTEAHTFHRSSAVTVKLLVPRPPAGPYGC
ncbi:hypothetical protein ADK41_28685 [Streptomyces caelestis]|uniref:Uncharacterized protein n=1 Tax=Streptomyces caelestis TaxID=36816 RepID=A0A0M8QNA5_9ACTN|nr:hypothetical protein ADK41_28685 [Streptomyces caelestis]